jgi:hypothetical protein
MRRLISTLFFAFLIALPSLAEEANMEAKPVLRIEEAMRVWQERWEVVTGAGQGYSLRNPNSARAGAGTRGFQWERRGVTW